ncbi:hypothetical protein ACVWZR_002045 [Bradyrhizobium sp. i1.3.1]
MEALIGNIIAIEPVWLGATQPTNGHPLSTLSENSADIREGITVCSAAHVLRT